ncbi:thioredoxin [Actinocorallia aurea]
MATVDLTKETFEDAFGREGLVLVDFWASWCGPCRNFAPVYERISEEHPDALFGKIDTEAERELAAAFEITSIPTLVVARDGIILYAEPGALPERALKELVDKALELDMDEVRAAVAARQGAAES